MTRKLRVFLPSFSFHFFTLFFLSLLFFNENIIHHKSKVSLIAFCQDTDLLPINKDLPLLENEPDVDRQIRSGDGNISVVQGKHPINHESLLDGQNIDNQTTEGIKAYYGKRQIEFYPPKSVVIVEKVGNELKLYRHPEYANNIEDNEPSIKLWSIIMPALLSPLTKSFPTLGRNKKRKYSQAKANVNAELVNFQLEQEKQTQEYTTEQRRELQEDEGRLLKFPDSDFWKLPDFILYHFPSDGIYERTKAWSCNFTTENLKNPNLFKNYAHVSDARDFHGVLPTFPVLVTGYASFACDGDSFLVPNAHFVMKDGFYDTREEVDELMHFYNEEDKIGNLKENSDKYQELSPIPVKYMDAFWRGKGYGSRPDNVQYTVSSPREKVLRAKLIELSSKEKTLKKKYLRKYMERRKNTFQRTGNLDNGDSNYDETSQYWNDNNHVLDAKLHHRIPRAAYVEHALLVDIAGHTTSWEGFIWKLLSSRPVIKIASAWTEWFYQYLEPGLDFILASENMEDLYETVIDALENYDAVMEPSNSVANIDLHQTDTNKSCGSIHFTDEKTVHTKNDEADIDTSFCEFRGDTKENLNQGSLSFANFENMKISSTMVGMNGRKKISKILEWEFIQDHFQHYFPIALEKKRKETNSLQVRIPSEWTRVY